MAQKLNHEERFHQNFLMNTYKKRGPIFVAGKGTRLISEDGREFIDYSGGYGCCIFGNSPEWLVDEILSQVSKVIHVSNVFYNRPALELAETLSNLYGDGLVFLSNSGTEANEAAIKLARKYWHDRGRPEKNEIICALNSFHGRTMGSLSATGQATKQEPFLPLLPGFSFVNFGDVEELKAKINSRTCAVMLEPIQGEGGVRVPPEGYLRKVAEICAEKGVLLILDEVQTGCGRTGRFFCYELEQAKPDIVTLGKGLGGGVPIGATIATREVASAFVPGSHGSTFGGNPLACAAAIATVRRVLQMLESGEIVRKGAEFKDMLIGLWRSYPEVVREVRGKGLMLAIEFHTEMAERIASEAIGHGLLFNDLSPTVIRFLPAFVMERPEFELACKFIEASIRGC